MTVYKVVFIGDSGVGKTSIIKAFLGEDISAVRSTIGIDFFELKKNGAKIIVWDFAGQIWFRDIIVQFIKGAHLIVMVFDLSRPETLFSLIKEWATYVKEFMSKDSFIIVIGNKKDIKSIDDSVIARILDSLKNEIKVDLYMETSALTKENIPKVFDAIFEFITLLEKAKTKGGN